MGNACCAEPKPDIQAKRSMDEEFFKLHVDAGHMNDRRRSFVDRLYTILGDETTLDAAAMAKAFDADACVEMNQCVGCYAAVLARSSGEEPASPRHRAGVASMAWRSTRRFRTNAP